MIRQGNAAARKQRLRLKVQRGFRLLAALIPDAAVAKRALNPFGRIGVAGDRAQRIFLEQIGKGSRRCLRIKRRLRTTHHIEHKPPVSLRTLEMADGQAVRVMPTS